MFFTFRSKFLIAVCSAALFAHAEDWPHFLGPTWNLHSSETNLDLEFPVEGPKKLWEFPKGKGHAGPVVVDDLVVLMHQIDEEEVIHCLDARTGKVKWEHRYPVQVDQSYGISDTPRSSPVIDLETKTVYTLGNDGDLIAFQLKKGKISWKVKLPETFGEAPFFFGQGSCPLVYKDKLIVHVGAPDACVVALNKKNGKVIWKAAHQWNGSYASPVIAEINGREKLMVFAGERSSHPTAACSVSIRKKARSTIRFPGGRRILRVSTRRAPFPVVRTGFSSPKITERAESCCTTTRISLPGSNGHRRISDASFKPRFITTVCCMDLEGTEV